MGLRSAYSCGLSSPNEARLLIVVLDILDPELGEAVVTAVHLGHGPFKRRLGAGRLLRHHGMHEMRQIRIHRTASTRLGWSHHELHLIPAMPCRGSCTSTELRHTLLPEPVRCPRRRAHGAWWRDPGRRGALAMSLPRAMVGEDGALWKASRLDQLAEVDGGAVQGGDFHAHGVASRHRGLDTDGFGLEAGGARSSVRLVDLPTRTPGAGRISNSVIAGPGVTRTSSP